MTMPKSSPITRRNALSGIGTAGLILASGPVSALERPLLTSLKRGRTTACGNEAVATSNVAGRISSVADFGTASRCRMTRGAAEGPYFICDGFESARDITGGTAGEPMTLAVRVVDETCAPIPGAFVDVWHCDAMGAYSGHDVNPDVPARGREVRLGLTRTPDLPARFLRGVLATDADGIAEFDMIYPGFYAGRAVHTHYKVHVGNRAYLTSQALYPEDINALVMRRAPYNASRPIHRVLNSEDRLLRNPDVFTIVEKGGRLLSLITLAVSI